GRPAAGRSSGAGQGNRTEEDEATQHAIKETRAETTTGRSMRSSLPLSRRAHKRAVTNGAPWGALRSHDPPSASDVVSPPEASRRPSRRVHRRAHRRLLQRDGVSPGTADAIEREAPSGRPHVGSPRA